MKSSSGALLSILALVTHSGPPAAAQSAGPPVGVRLELSQSVFYEGEPLWVRVTVRSGAAEELANPVKTPLVNGFRAKAAGGAALAGVEHPELSEPARPDRLAPRSFYGAVMDLTRIYPALGKVGTYEINWAADGLLSDLLTVRVIPRYDPEKHYSAEIDTSEGMIMVHFFPGNAPIAVKAFIDMAQSGFYDGLQFQEVQPDAFVAGGNPAFGEARERQPITYPAEQSTLPLVSGTVVVKPVGAAPPANGPEFVILLRPQPAWSGQVTVLGQVVRGFDVAQAISRVATTGPGQRPFFKPLKDVTIRRIQVRELLPVAPDGR